MPASTPPDPAPPHAQAVSGRRTLPPPEWQGRDSPRSAASLLLDRATWDAPVARRSGPRAELAQLFARLETAEGDDAAERGAAAALARSLATRGTQLDVATRLARRALLLGEDTALREELAGWFVTLGEPALAAATLRLLVPEAGGPEATALLVRIGVLLARAGEARAARDALNDAALADASDPVPLEIEASLAAWAPTALEPHEAAEAYLAAADRRDARGEKAAAFEDLMRAFEICPAHAAAAEALASALLARGRGGAADEIRREHANALGAAGRAAHLRRMRQAVKDGDLPRALGAAFDARLDGDIDLRSVLASIDPVDGAEESPLGIDGLLERAGMHELLAARMELASDFLAGRERARARVALGRLYTGPLGRADRAVDAWIDALVADPSSEVALAALRRHGATTRDYAPLVEALVRAAQTPVLPNAERVTCLQELVVLAEERLADPGLAAWAVEKLGSVARKTDDLRASAERLEPRLRLQDEALATARQELAVASDGTRRAALARVAAILAGRPDSAAEYVEILRELAALEPEERAHAVALERVLTRLDRTAELAAWLTEAEARVPSTAERARLRVALATLHRRRGDNEGALATLLPLLSEPGAHGPAVSLTLLLAAQREDKGARALALCRLSSQLSPSLRAVLLAVAAEEQLAVGDVDGARAAAEQACNADPSLARPALTRARVGAVVGGRAGAEWLERAMGIVVPRPALSNALATILEALGEPMLGAAWAQRAGALRPGDLEAARARLARALAGDDGTRLADTLAWLLSQPQCLTSAADVVALAVERLVELVPQRAGALARRALDVLGPRDPVLRAAALRVADQAGERGLGIAAIERWLATGSLGAERATVLLDLSRRRKAAGDADGAARALCRALAEGAPPSEVLREVEQALPTRSSDGEIALLQARAEVLSALPEAEQSGTARVWRELGAALWDLAADRLGALRAWERAAVLDVEHGAERLASDLLAFGGESLALERLLEHARRRGDTPEAARYYGVAASIALGAGLPSEAFSHARRTLEIDPSRSDAIAVAERAAGEGELDALDGLYDRLATTALGCFGERAVRYRAARQFEKRGLAVRALRHAVGAFEAVPSEGVAFVTLARLADKTQQRGEMVRAIERVAERSRSPELGAAWLRRAAVFADDSEEGTRQRVDVLLRALAVRVDVDLVESLALAMGALVQSQPDERDGAELRFARAARSALARIEGPDGARVAIAVAKGALETFDAAVLAADAIERAAACDGSLDEFARLLPHARAIAETPVSGALVQKLVELGAQRFASAGTPLLELGAAIAEARSDAASAARLLASAAARDPEHPELVRRAESIARQSGDPSLLAAILDVLPDRGRFDLTLELVHAAERSGDLERAVEALERARKFELEPAERDRWFECAVELLRHAGRREDLERVLVEELARPELAAPAVARAASELGALLGARGRASEALDVLRGALERVPSDRSLLNDVVTLGRQAGDRERQAWALTRLVELGGEPADRAAWLRELAPLLEAIGEHSAALTRWSELLELDPSEPEALAALEHEAERQADYDAVARLLDRRAALAGRVDDVRKLRLRRAGVLEQRLARPDEARSELEALLAATGDHLGVLRVLADLTERLGDPLAAAPLWLRASGLGSDRDEAAELAQRACQAYLAGGDVEGAHRTLASVGAWVERGKLYELNVEIERRRENPAGLADALDELATHASKPNEERARLLVEAARATLAAGDRERALERAARAARVLPGFADAELLARHLEYVVRGVGSAEDARQTVEALRAVAGELDPERAELRAFLLAEGLDRAGGSPVAGLAELERASARLGARALLSAGKAERLAALGRLPEALLEFDAALDGELRDLRTRPRLALLAGETAHRAGELDRALHYLELAASDPETQAAASAELDRVRDAIAGLAASGTPGADALDAELDDASPLREHIVLDQDEEAPVAIAFVPSSPPSRGEPVPPPAPAAQPAPSSLREAVLALESLVPSPQVSTKPPSPRKPRLTSSFAGSSAEEVRLHVALADGSRAAGYELLALLAGDATRAHDRVAVYRRLAVLVPGDRDLLAGLAQAARDDKNPDYASAVEHVAAVVRGDLPGEPPSLADIAAEPEAARSLLMKETRSPTLEALSLVWETAGHLFQRDPGAYGITGLERVQPMAPTPVGRAFGSVARSLGALRTPLFQRRTVGPVTVGIALLSSPAVVLSGDVDAETAELQFHLGAMVAATAPQLVMLFGMPEAQARSVLRALGFAFGPARPDASGIGPALTLAEMLWQSIPARPQRRLRELCHDLDALDYDQAVLQARTAARRAGLFVTGHLAVAAREVALEDGLDAGLVGSPGGLARLIATSPSIASLYQLSLMAEYAELRWREPRITR